MDRQLSINSFYLPLCAVLAISTLVSCGQKAKSKSDSSVSALEEAYCSDVTAVSGGVSLTGTAHYQYYKAVYELTRSGLVKDSNNEPFSNPIRHAEVRVFNSKGSIVQCGETDDSGGISLAIPAPLAMETYTVAVDSRGNNNYVKASVLDKVNTKSLYSVKATISVSPDSTTISIPDLVALATDTLEGGAFHIYDRILQVNDYLRNHTTDSQCPLCQGFTVAPKVTVFWAKGFNPSAYFGETSPLSFFDVSGSVDATPSLYILGGSNGDVLVSDTDHFDESVIIHEYGHFLENTYWRSDSPGGYHNGNMIIDPRLALSEGFSNFLPSAVLGRSTYIDTIGSPDGSPSVGVYLNLEEENGVSTGVRDRIITKTQLGEGTYREVSVSRAFYDYIDTSSFNGSELNEKTYDSNGVANNASEISELPFAFLWLALTNVNFGLKAPDVHFVSMGRFNKSLYAAMDVSSYADISGEKAKLDSARLGEFQTNDASEYAPLQILSDTTCDRTMNPVVDRTASDGTSYHDIFLSSDFLRLDHPGGDLNLTLSYTGTGATAPDLDLYVFKEVHSITEASDLIGKSEATNSTAGNTESISVSNVPAGTYMILVNADTEIAFSGGATYRLTGTGGKYLCNAQ